MFVWRVEAFEEEGLDIGGVYVSGMDLEMDDVYTKDAGGVEECPLVPIT
jgi:hypothetical protein